MTFPIVEIKQLDPRPEHCPGCGNRFSKSAKLQKRMTVRSKILFVVSMVALIAWPAVLFLALSLLGENEGKNMARHLSNPVVWPILFAPTLFLASRAMKGKKKVILKCSKCRWIETVPDY